ncbi:hypothetical protein Ahy_B01g056938 [Arachis hypogaea]|uniref:Peptidase A2 domain-containing protein n=1 Tax=Arachis hypogaea TaxID=3818 RepID=A0A445AZW0_ARAHY|nr:hypothetical protein Ahy_B01g056938 [Arachis hypogaea]
MVGTISIIPTEYLGKYKENLSEDYDVEDEEVFAFVREDEELGCFKKPTKKQKLHLRPLHITACMSGICIDKVLVNGGATISLLPENMLIKVGKYFDDLIPTNVSVTDYSGVSTPSKGLVTLQVQVGSSSWTTVFMVVPLKACYNALLGQEWILFWNDEGMSEVIKADSNLYVEQMHVDFKVCNDKMKPLDIDRMLKYYDCEGCF